MWKLILFEIMNESDYRIFAIALQIHSGLAKKITRRVYVYVHVFYLRGSDVFIENHESRFSMLSMGFHDSIGVAQKWKMDDFSRFWMDQKCSL